MLHLTAKDNGRELATGPHEEFVVALASNRSTGYRWKIALASQGRLGAGLLSHRYIAPKKSVPGAAGKEIWRFRPVGSGRMDLGFLYVRPSQRHEPPAQDVDFTIYVAPLATYRRGAP